MPRPSYLRRLRVQHLALYDANVNGWLDHQPGRRFLVRGLSAGEGRPGILRALLSDAFRIVDNLDVLLSALDGIQRAGAEVDIAQADLTDTRMYLKVRSTAIAEAAPALLGGYVSPFTGARGGTTRWCSPTLNVTPLGESAAAERVARVAAVVELTDVL